MVLGQQWDLRLTFERQCWLLYAVVAWQALGRLSSWALEETCIAVMHFSLCKGGSDAFMFVHRVSTELSLLHHSASRVSDDKMNFNLDLTTAQLLRFSDLPIFMRMRCLLTLLTTL